MVNIYIPCTFRCTHVYVRPYSPVYEYWDSMGHLYCMMAEEGLLYIRGIQETILWATCSEEKLNWVAKFTGQIIKQYMKFLFIFLLWRITKLYMKREIWMHFLFYIFQSTKLVSAFRQCISSLVGACALNCRQVWRSWEYHTIPCFWALAVQLYY